MERPYNERKQHQTQSSRTCCVNNKLLQTQDSAIYAPTTSYSEEDIIGFHNDIDETSGKPNHHNSDEKFQSTNREKYTPYGNSNKLIWA